jgi:hypothetical protein
LKETTQSSDTLCNELAGAIEQCNYDEIEKLVRAGANVNCRTATGCPVFWLAPSHDCLQFLFRLGADVNLRHRLGHTMLHSEASLGKHNVERIALLLERVFKLSFRVVGA